MFKKIAEFFTGKKPEAAPEAPYKVETAPVEAAPTSAVDAVVVVPDAVVPSGIVEQAPVTAPVPSPTKKPRAPAAPKKPRAPKAK